MTATLDMDVLTGVPEPTRSRWQPLRAGILNLYHYDEQTFAFHRGRLLIRGNNGSGKSMALEVLLPYVLDADLTPSRLSTFGGRDRNMYLWLLGHDNTGTRTSERAYVWVEFGRRHLDGTSEFFTAGAMLEGVRGGDVKAHYFTTAARLGVHLSVGGPGREPLNKLTLAALLTEQVALGRPGKVHEDPKSHRRAVNGALYRLSDKRFDALRATLRQLRRPKLSDKLDEAGLNLVLRDSLPPVADATVADLAEGFERLDRHAAAVTELEATIGHLGTLREGYRRYARVAAAARADAVAAAETAIGQVHERAAAAQTAFEAARAMLEQINARRDAICERLAAIRGRHDALTGLDAFQQGQDLAPLRELVTGLARTAASTAETHRRLAQATVADATAAERAAEVATNLRDAAHDARDRATVHSDDAHTTTVDAALAAALADLRGRDVADEAALATVLDDARALLTRLESELDPWEHQVAGLGRLDEQVREKVAALNVTRVETRRAEAEVPTAEEELNHRLEDERGATMAWLDALTAWAHTACQLSAGQAPPLPWEPQTAADRARRWADEAAASRTQALLAEQGALIDAAGIRTSAAAAARRAAGDLDEVAGLVNVAAARAAAHRAALEGYRDIVTGWTSGLAELPRGEAAPVWSEVPADQVGARARAWADAATAARTRSLLGEQSLLRRSLEQLKGRIDLLAEREEYLAAGGLPELDVPVTRQASREGRPGAPLFMLVEFADVIDPAERLGVEAAAVGSGLADAWVSPDGQLLRAADGTPLLDTQLHATGAAQPGTSLADVLVPAGDAAVPSSVVSALFATVAVMATAMTAVGPGLTLGRDGTWRADTLTGAHTVSEVTLIGAGNREASRLASLAAVRAELTEARNAREVLTVHDAVLGAALERTTRERASVPVDDNVVQSRDAARDAAADTAARASATRDAVLAATGALPLARAVDEVPTGEAAAALSAQCEPLLGAVAADPADPDRAAAVRVLAADVAALAAAREEAAAALRAAAGRARDGIEVTAAERAARPDDTAVRDARGTLSAARTALAGARTRLAERQREERAAQDAADAAAGALRAARVGAALPADLDVPALTAALARYHTSAERWLRAGVEAVQATGAATLALARSVSSSDTAEQARTDAKSHAAEHQRQAERLRALTDDYGEDYERIIAELDTLTAERDTLDREQGSLAAAESSQLAARAEARAEQQAVERARLAVEDARTEAGGAFLAAYRVGMLAAAGMPTRPPTTDTSRPGDVVSDPDDDAAAGLGVRARLTWARAVRDAAGDRLIRDSPAVEQAANRVNETRYNPEPNLAGRVSIRDELQSGLLLLYASRGVQTLPLVEMIAALETDLARDRQLLATDETELFRRFLADSTRREVTSRVRDARTQVRGMADLMAAHPTGSGIQVRLHWVPDERNAPGMQDIVTLMGKDAPLESEKERLQEFFRGRVAQVRASADTDYKAQMADLLDYRQWWRFAVEYRRSHSERWTALTSKEHGALSGGEKAVCLHLPLFAAAATYCVSAEVRAIQPDGTAGPGAPRLILLDEVFAGVDEDNRGELFDLIRDLDLDLVATSESEQGLYPQLDGLAIYQLYASDQAVLAARTVWDGRMAHRMLDEDLLNDLGDEADLFTP